MLLFFVVKTGVVNLPPLCHASLALKFVVSSLMLALCAYMIFCGLLSPLKMLFDLFWLLALLSDTVNTVVYIADS